jgi:hypothetical protein
MGDFGFSIVTLIFLPPKHIHKMTGSERDHQGQPETENYVKQGNVVLGPDVPEIHQDDAQPVERVKNDRGNQSYFGDTHQGCLICPNDRVVSLGTDPDQRRVENVDEQKEVNSDSGNAVKNPRPHAFTAAI